MPIDVDYMQGIFTKKFTAKKQTIQQINARKKLEKQRHRSSFKRK